MPIYEFQCSKCKNRFEEWLTIGEAESSQLCPKCKSSAQRIISNTSFVLKGEGWYATEYGNRKNQPTEEKSADPGESVDTKVCDDKGSESSSPEPSKSESSKSESSKSENSKKIKNKKKTEQVND